MEKKSPLEQELDSFVSLIGKGICIAVIGFFSAIVVGCWLKFVMWAYNY